MQEILLPALPSLAVLIEKKKKTNQNKTHKPVEIWKPVKLGKKR